MDDLINTVAIVVIQFVVMVVVMVVFAFAVMIVVIEEVIMMVLVVVQNCSCGVVMTVMMVMMMVVVVMVMVITIYDVSTASPHCAGEGMSNCIVEGEADWSVRGGAVADSIGHQIVIAAAIGLHGGRGEPTLGWGGGIHPFTHPRTHTPFTLPTGH